MIIITSRRAIVLWIICTLLAQLNIKFLNLNDVYHISTPGSDNYYLFVYVLLLKFLIIKSNLHSDEWVIVGGKVKQIGREILTSLESRCNLVFLHNDIIRQKDSLFHVLNRKYRQILTD